MSLPLTGRAIGFQNTIKAVSPLAMDPSKTSQHLLLLSCLTKTMQLTTKRCFLERPKQHKPANSWPIPQTNTQQIRHCCLIWLQGSGACRHNWFSNLLICFPSWSSSKKSLSCTNMVIGKPQFCFCFSTRTHAGSIVQSDTNLTHCCSQQANAWWNQQSHCFPLPPLCGSMRHMNTTVQSCTSDTKLVHCCWCLETIT